MITGRLNFDGPSTFDPKALTIAPSSHAAARETSALAAAENAPHRTSQNAQLLRLITEAGDLGMSDPEIQKATGWERASICLRRHDLAAFLTPATRRSLSDKGRWCVCWRRKTATEMAVSE